MTTTPTPFEPQPVTSWTVEDALAVAEDQENNTGKEFSRAMSLLAWEVRRMRHVVAEYVEHIESGAHFDALVCLVPGLVDDTGQYGAVSS